MEEVNTNTNTNTNLAEIKEEIPTFNKIMILDTAHFIRLKPLNLNEGWKYYATEFIIKEIKDEKARDFYELNKNFIIIKNPSRESMRIISVFSKLSNDLQNLSIPDLSVLALAYDLIKELGMDNLLRKEPMKYELVETIKSKKKVEEPQEELITTEASSPDNEDGFVEVKKNKKQKHKKSEKFFGDNDEGEWITPENIDSKLGKFKIEEEKLKKENENPIKVHICTADFTVQNVALKMGIPVQGIDGMKIRKIKNYILKCYSCNFFIFDTSKLFCVDCGYNTLMKIACSINSEGVLKIYDKNAEARSRGTQVKIINFLIFSV
jgi:RNA-binding protein NOB1